jgi:hypothetical protein
MHLFLRVFLCFEASTPYSKRMTVQQELEMQRRQEQEKEEDNTRHEVERKKPKINGFDPNLVVPAHITPRTSGYALNKIKNLQYVELDYFTIKGCHEAQLEHEVTSNHNTLGLTRVNNIASFQPISSLKPSKNTHQDEEFSGEEMVLEMDKSFNLGKIGVNLMRNIMDKVQDKGRQREITEVRNVFNV